MRFDELKSANSIIPFSATLMIKDTIIGRINGTFDRSQLVSGFFAQIAGLPDGDPVLVVAMVGLAERMLVTWDLMEDENTPVEFCRLWDMPPVFVAQLLSAMFASANGEPPDCLKGLV